LPKNEFLEIPAVMGSLHALANATLNDAQRASKARYMEAAHNVLEQLHADNMPHTEYDQLKQALTDNLEMQNFNRIFDKQGKPIVQNGAPPITLEQFLKNEENLFQHTITMVKERGVTQPIRNAAAAEGMEAGQWLERMEKGGKARQFLSMASVGVGSVIMIDGVLNVIAAPKRKTVQDDGSIKEERASPLSKELAKIAIGAGTMGAGFLLALERKGAPAPHSL
jgi:hypothetical protein